MKKEADHARFLTHGAGGRRRTRTYRAWQEAKRRCFDTDRAPYADYGGRGVTMAPEWRDDFAAFLAHMGECPPGLTLDRIDTDGDYRPGNCRWATFGEQSRNKRSNIWVDLNGEKMILKDFATRLGVNYKALRYQVVERGVDPAVASRLLLKD